MDALQNRVIAGFLCLLIIIASSVVGVASTLAPMRAQVIELFHVGEGRGSPGIGSDIAEISRQVHNITVIARRYLAPDYPAIERADHAMYSHTRATRIPFNPRQMRLATDELVATAQALNAALSGLELTDQDRNLLAGCMAEIENRMALIAGNNRYNQAAFNFNQSLNRFPANILGPAAGVRPLELFE